MVKLKTTKINYTCVSILCVCVCVVCVYVCMCVCVCVCVCACVQGGRTRPGKLTVQSIMHPSFSRSVCMVTSQPCTAVSCMQVRADAMCMAHINGCSSQ